MRTLAFAALTAATTASALALDEPPAAQIPTLAATAAAIEGFAPAG